MSKVVTQVVDNQNEDGSGGSITVLTEDENGRQSASTMSYNNYVFDGHCDSKSVAIERATEASLNK